MSQADSKLGKALRLLDQQGLDGLIIYSEGVCSILSPSYLHYFSECRPLGASAAVLSKSGKVTLLAGPHWDTERFARKSWISDIRPAGNLAADLPSLIKEFNFRGIVGLAGSKETSAAMHAAIAAVADVRPADGIIEEIARKKTTKELEIVYDTARIADVGFDAFLEWARPGIREYELVAEMEFAMRAAGADDMFILLSAAPHNKEMAEPTDRRLRPGDIVIGEITPVREGQFIQLCRTIILGKPQPVLREKYDLLLRAFDASLREVRDGVPASLMAKAMNGVFSEAGYGEYCYPPYMRARGHGFGVGSIAPGGAVDEDTKTNLEAQQVIVVHPNQYIPETGYLACGETFLVTKSGAERLAKTETKLHVREV